MSREAFAPPEEAAISESKSLSWEEKEETTGGGRDIPGRGVRQLREKFAKGGCRPQKGNE